MSYSLTYILRKDKVNSVNECPICLRYTVNRKNYKIPLGESVDIHKWDDVNRLPFSNVTRFRAIYSDMLKLEERVTKLITDFHLDNGRYPETDELKNLLNRREILTAPKTHSLVRDVFQDFINHSEVNKNVQKSTLKIYKSTYNKWISYEDSIERRLRLVDISFKTLEDFKLYLRSQNLIYSSVGKSIKTVKTLFNKYVIKREKIQMDLSYKEVKVDVVNENNFLCLDELEFETLRKAVFYTQFEINGEEINFKDSERYIGRMFLFMCSTGLSFIDMINLQIQNIVIEDVKLKKKKSNQPRKRFVYLKVTRQKTKHEALCLIPVMGLTIELLISLLGKPIEFMGANVTEIPNEARISVLNRLLKEKGAFDKNKQQEDFRIFKNVNNQVFNREIKKLFDKLKFHQWIHIRKDRNEDVLESKRKCDLISSHTGRRTYITLCLAKGIRPDQVMKTTGHKKFETMRRYINYTANSINEEYEAKLNKK